MAFTRSRTALTLRRLPLSDRSFLPHDQGKGRIRVSLSLYSRRGWDFNFGFRWQHIASGDTIQSMTVVTRNMQPTCHLYFIHPSCCHDEHHLGGSLSSRYKRSLLATPASARIQCIPACLVPLSSLLWPETDEKNVERLITQWGGCLSLSLDRIFV